MQQGNLFVVAGPIGNMQDITFRTLETLKTVDFILSEDTRETSKILNFYNIEKPQVSYRDQNHMQIMPKVKSALESGLNLALVSDSGTPLISDPGYKLVHEIKMMGFNVVPLPGPSAAISALSVSGLPTDKFTFLGFLPKSDKQRTEIIKTFGSLDSTLVIYESPYRIKELLENINSTLGNRIVCLAGEMTKMHEKIITKPVSDLISQFDKLTIKGEYVVLVGKSGL